jgi:hypothetical protein
LSYGARSGSGYGNNKRRSSGGHSGKSCKHPTQMQRSVNKSNNGLCLSCGDIVPGGASNVPFSLMNVTSQMDYLLGEDIFARQQIEALVAEGRTVEDALHVYVNGVEGDGSQLPPKLAQYAQQKGWLDGWEYPQEP